MIVEQYGLFEFVYSAGILVGPVIGSCLQIHLQGPMLIFQQRGG